MIDDVVFNKLASIERSVRRARDAYAAAAGNFATDFTRQDAAILNIQRACEAALDVAVHVVRRERMGWVQSAREAFSLLEQAGWIPPDIAESMKRMIGYRNVAVHDYQALQLPITIDVIEHRLDEFLRFGRKMMERERARSGDPLG